MGIAMIQPIQSVLDRGEDQLIELSLLRTKTKQLRAEHRGQAQRTYCGDDHDDADNPTQLFKQDTRHTTHHCQGQEHRQHG